MNPNNSLSIHAIESVDELNRIRHDWNQLVGQNPFLCWEWMSNWWKHFGTDHQLMVVVARQSNGEVVGLAPWYLDQGGAGRRVIKFLGSGKACSDHLSLLCRENLRDQVVESIVRWLISVNHDSAATSHWDSIELICVDREDAALKRLVDCFSQLDYTLHQKPNLQTWAVDLPDNWQQYLKILSKSNRRRVRRAIGRIDEDPNLAVECITQVSDFEYIWELFVDLHQRRRHSLGEKGCFDFPRFAAFLHDVSRELMVSGRLQVELIRLDDKPLAVEYILSGHQRVYCYQSGIDPERLDEKPGWLSIAAAMRRSIQQDCKTFDFLRGDETYKSQWRAEPTPTMDIRIVAPKAAARLRHQAWLATSTVKNWLHQTMASLPTAP